MKNLDAKWVENLARRATSKPLEVLSTPQSIAQTLTMFLDELHVMLSEYCHYFNELVENQNPHSAIRIFRLGNPRPGVMILRGKEKLVISLEGARSLKARLTQIHGIQESSFDIVGFEPVETAFGELAWVCIEDGQRVNAEMVAKHHVGPFFADGGAAYADRMRPVQTH